MFGAGGGTSSYEEVRNTDLIILWGSNARDAHPIFFHHVLKGIQNGAKLIVVDPRRTASAQWADLWLGLDVGTDIPLANAIAREMIEAGLVNSEFIERATSGFDAYRDSVQKWTLEEAERVTGIPADAIREADRAVNLVPVTKDAEWSGYLRANLARVYALLGERAKAVDELENVLARPGPLSAAWLRVDPFWDSLRESSKFQRLVAVRT